MNSRQEAKAETRKQIIEVTARMIREHGIDGANVNDIMKEVGLTRGTFYAHFDSKEQLVEEAYVAAMGEGRSFWFKGLEDKSFDDYLITLLDRYCNTKHRSKPATGCAMPSLGSEIGLLEDDEGLKETFEGELMKSVGLITQRLSEEPELDEEAFPNEDRALALVSGLVGSLVLSRAVANKKLSNRILNATKQQFAEYYLDK